MSSVNDVQVQYKVHIKVLLIRGKYVIQYQV